MSTDRPPAPTVDDRHEGGIDPANDPHGVIPEDFLDAYDADSVPEALAKAERAASRTPEDEMRRCPECESVRITIKVGAVECDHQREERFKCTNGHHFDDPLPSRTDAAPGEQQTLGEVQR